MHYVYPDGPFMGMIACKPPTANVPYTEKPNLVTCPVCKKEMNR